MNDFLIRPIAERVEQYRNSRNIDGTPENDWEIAVEFLTTKRNTALEKYLDEVFENRLGDHGVLPIVPKGY